MTEQVMLEALRSSQPPAAAERFREAVRVIDAVEGQLRFDQAGRLIALDLSRDRTSIDAGQLHALAVFPHVRRLRLAGSNLGNAQLRWIAERWNALQEHLSNLKHLRFLDISGNPRVSDEAVQALGRMAALRELKIARTEISPAGLAHLRQRLPDIHITHDALGASGVP